MSILPMQIHIPRSTAEEFGELFFREFAEYANNFVSSDGHKVSLVVSVRQKDIEIKGMKD